MVQIGAIQPGGPDVIRLAATLTVLILTAVPAVVGRAISPPIKFVQIGSMAGPADMVEADATHLYIAAEATLTVVDVSKPERPARAGAYTFPTRIWGFRVIGSLAYVAADFFGLGILDLSNPATPALRGSVKAGRQAKNVAVSGTKAVVADHVAGVSVIDISTLDQPKVITSVYVDGYARDVATLGNFAYAVDNPTGLYVMDLSKPDLAEYDMAVQSANTPRTIKIISGAGDRKFAVLAGGGVLQTYDLGTPSAPALLSTFRTPGGVQRIAVQGTLVYVADGHEGLQVVDLSDPSRPQIVGNYKTTSPVRDVAVAGPVVFLAVGALPTGVARSQGGGDIIILRSTQAL
jgi:hypothetical protein